MRGQPSNPETKWRQRDKGLFCWLVEVQAYIVIWIKNMHGVPIMELIRFKLQLLNAYSEGKGEQFITHWENETSRRKWTESLIIIGKNYIHKVSAPIN